MATTSTTPLPTDPSTSPTPTTSTTTTTSTSILIPPTQPTTTSTTPTPTLLPPTTSSDSTISTSTSLSTSFSTDTIIGPITSPTSTSSSPVQITTPTVAPPNTPVITTSVVVVTPSSATPSTSPQSSNGSSGFFNNKGAVAGVFTVIGLIVLAILVALITNGIRRRRAKKFDDEIAAAARDAANAQVPNFGYDDDDFRPGGGGAYNNGGANSGAKFSDASHGTYTQPPMSVPESYGMREIPHHGPGPAPGEYFDAGGGYGTGAATGAAGAAGIGVARARSMRDGSYAAGLQEGALPYAAFAVPNTRGNGSQYPPGMIRGAGGPEFDLQRRPSQYTQQSGSDYSAAALSKSKSLTGTITTSAPSHHSDPSYFPPNNTGTDGSQGYPNSFGAYATNITTPSSGVVGGSSHLPQIPSSRSEENLESAYDGYVVEETHQSNNTHPHHADVKSALPDHMPNPFSANGRNGSYGDETDDEVEEPKRVLKVANE